MKRIETPAALTRDLLLQLWLGPDELTDTEFLDSTLEHYGLEEEWTEEQTAAAARVHIPHDCDDTSWREYSGHGHLMGLVDWLVDHPKASAYLTRWSLIISSPDVDDCIGFDRCGQPTELNAAVEDYDVTGSAKRGYYEVSWHLG